ncbi:MAG: hypothetical protein ACSHX0_13390 [Akkermansiaceae bacterium]
MDTRVVTFLLLMVMIGAVSLCQPFAPSLMTCGIPRRFLAERHGMPVA